MPEKEVISEKDVKAEKERLEKEEEKERIKLEKENEKEEKKKAATP